MLHCGIFSNKLKIVEITPIFKGDNVLLTLKKIMSNRVYKHLDETNLLYKNQFGFPKAHFTSTL